MPKCYWGRKETEYLGVITGHGTLRASPDKISAVIDWHMPETQRLIKSFILFCSYYDKFIHHFSDCAAPLTCMCRKNLPSNIVHTEATKVAYETLKSRMMYALVFLILKMGHEAEFVVATDASKVGITRVLLQEDAKKSPSHKGPTTRSPPAGEP